ncbi:MAG: murein L,D-transpeptidase [Alphaproteobacteria bacterium]|nr:MAG: murein L,D-transpeptidase [Alphaproteobacteria bacterium]
MSDRRFDRVIAVSMLALMLAMPIAGLAQETGSVDPGKVTAAPNAAVGVEQPQSEALARSADTASPSPASLPTSSAPPSAPATAAEQKPDPVASLDPADRVIAEKIRDLLATKADRIFASKKERSAVEAYYQNRNLAPFWLDKGIENARAKSVIARLKNSDADGLDPADYKAPNFAMSGVAAEALAEAELKLTQTVLTYARHVQAGRFPYGRISHNIELPQAPPEPADVLSRIAGATDAAKALDDFSPQHEPYRKLKAMLAQLRGKSGGSSGDLSEGPVLSYSRKTQMEDARVPFLRERLKLPGESSDLRYDARLADAVKKFQYANGLPPTGNLDARTVRELNGPTHDREIDIVIANMERWRWYPRDLGKAHVLVNEPDFSLKVLHEGRQVWSTRIVIGKPSMQTPLLSETMKTVTINPTWNVPPSIVHNEYLPALAQDPTVLSRMGLRVSYSGGGVHISMPPGDNNALGRVRFNFPNRFLVYQHDTPDKHLFAHDVRAESHGCMRVQDPAKYAEVLFNIARPDEQWTADKVKSMFGRAEQDIAIQPAQIWVHLTYQTAFVDDAGKLQTRRDVYNLDGRIIAAIKSERGVIESGSERKHEPEIASAAPRRPSRVSRSFFSPTLGAGPYGGSYGSSYGSPYGGSYYARPRPPRAVYYR